MFRILFIATTLVFAFGCTKKEYFPGVKFSSHPYNYVVVTKGDGRVPAQAVGEAIAMIDRVIPMIASKSGMSESSATAAIYQALSGSAAVKAGISLQKAGMQVSELGKLKPSEVFSTAEQELVVQLLSSGKIAQFTNAFKGVNCESIVANVAKDLNDPGLMAKYPVKNVSNMKNLPVSGGNYATDVAMSQVPKEGWDDIISVNKNLASGSKGNPTVGVFKDSLTVANTDAAKYAEDMTGFLSSRFCKVEGGKVEISINNTLVPVYADIANYADKYIREASTQLGRKLTQEEEAQCVVMAQIKATGQSPELAIENVKALSERGPASATEGETCDLFNVGAALNGISAESKFLTWLKVLKI